MERITKLAFILLALFPGSLLSATTTPIKIYISDNPQSNYVAKEISNKLRDKRIHFETINITAKETLTITDSSSNLLISIGTQATSLILSSKPNTAIYSLMVPKAGLDILLKKNGYPLNPNENKISALYIDQPFERFVEMTKNIVPDIKNIGVLLDKDSDSYRHKLETETKKRGLKLITSHLDDENPMRNIETLVKQSDAIILMPNKSINRLVAKWVLFSAYKHHKPIIGFSKRFINAGALSVLYSDLDDIVAESTNDIFEFIKNKKFSQPARFPEKFHYEHNDAIFRALGIEKDKALEKLNTNDN